MIVDKTIAARPFDRVKIFYFSGTGNAAKVSGWMAEEAVRVGMEAEVVSLDIMRGKELTKEDHRTLIGFCSPTHGFNFPPVMLKFLLRFPRGKNPVFVMNTRAGSMLFKYHICGLSGIAQLLAALVLLVKGYKIVGMRPVDMPSNWISIHPGFRDKSIRKIFSHCERKTRRFAGAIFSGRRRYRALYDIIQDIAITPIALGYYFVGRYVLAKSFVASRDCTKCGLCIKACPVGAIVERDNRPFWTLNCESCMRCMNACPERAIQTAHGLVIGSMVLISTIGMEWLWFFSVGRLPQGALTGFLENGLIEFTIASALAIPFLLLSYWLFHYLMRYRFFERMIILTSLTVFSWWRRYQPKKSLK